MGTLRVLLVLAVFFLTMGKVVGTVHSHKIVKNFYGLLALSSLSTSSQKLSVKTPPAA